MDENKIIAQWNEIVTLVSETEPNVLKNARGVAAAGVRARKGLRTIKAKSTALVKLMVELDKVAKAARPKREKKAKA